MSLSRLLSTTTLVGLLSIAGACDKGPTTGEPTPAAKAGEPAGGNAEGKAPATDTEGATSAAPTADGKGQVFGAGVSEMERVSISDIVADPEAFDGKTVQVEGMVTDVCAKRGCWFEMAGSAPGEKARFKVNDGEMVFPMSAKGKSAVAQGKVIAQKLSLEDTRAMEAHYAKESGREFDPESITEGKTVFRIAGTGAIIRE